MDSPGLHLVRSDWYMLCCAVHHVSDCEPKGYLVSSCESLLSFLTAKIFISIQAVFAILVNGGVLMRLLTGKYKAPDRPLKISLVSTPEYVFQILLISLNSVLLVILCASAFSLFGKVYLPQKSVHGTGSSHSQHFISKIGARLLLLLFFNFVCWIPILCAVSIMLSARNVHEDVLIWIAIFILPISATTDPFLYNIHLLKKRTDSEIDCN